MLRIDPGDSYLSTVIPAVTGGINVIQRRLNATVGEGVIYDLRSFQPGARINVKLVATTGVGAATMFFMGMTKLQVGIVGAVNTAADFVMSPFAGAMADRGDLEFTYSLIDRVFRLSVGELADFSGAKYDGDFSLSLEEAQRRKHAFVAPVERRPDSSRPTFAKSCSSWSVRDVRRAATASAARRHARRPSFSG